MAMPCGGLPMGPEGSRARMPVTGQVRGLSTTVGYRRRAPEGPAGAGGRAWFSRYHRRLAPCRLPVELEHRHPRLPRRFIAVLATPVTGASVGASGSPCAFDPCSPNSRSPHFLVPWLPQLLLQNVEVSADAQGSHTNRRTPYVATAATFRDVLWSCLRPLYATYLGMVLGAGTVAAMALTACVTSGLALAAGPGTCGQTGSLSGATTCSYTTVGSDTFTVPAGVTSVTVDVVGGQGGHYFIAGDAAHGGSPAGDITGRPGGGGGEAKGTLTGLAAGQVVQVDVAGKGINGTAASRSGGMMNGPSGGSGAVGGFGGSNGGVAGGPGDANGANGGTAVGGGNGSGGGGSSDVRNSPGGCAAQTCALSDRVLVGAGGGGGGGTGGQGTALGGAGGNGGGATGADGGDTVDGGNHGVSAKGATQSAGGAGGLNPGRHNPGAHANDPRFGGDGANGAPGAGGVGGTGNRPCTGTQDPPCGGGQNATSAGGGAGGGGGGGYFGGGGGSGGGGTFGGGGGAGGGGAGGSAYAAASVTSPTLTAGVNTGTINGGNGRVTISWSGSSANGLGANGSNSSNSDSNSSGATGSGSTSGAGSTSAPGNIGGALSGQTAQPPSGGVAAGGGGTSGVEHAALLAVGAASLLSAAGAAAYANRPRVVRSHSG